MHFLLFLLISSWSALFLKEESTTPFTKASGNYADDSYVESNKIKSETFTYSSNGDKENHPIANAFSDASSDSQGWVAKNPNTNTFYNSIIINFDKQAKIEAILHDASYSIKNEAIEYNGFPLILKIYSSTSDDEPFRLQATFSGECPEQDNTWTRTQFILPNPITCTRLQIEFCKVTADNSFSDGAECPAVNKIHFIGKLQYYESTFEKVKNNYGVTNYVNSHKITTDHFNYDTTGDKSNFPKENLFDGKDNTYWASQNPNTDSFKASISINFTETTTLEGIIYSPSFYSGTPRQFNGFPYKLTVYTALKDRPLTIHTVFSGDLPTTNDWGKTQYVFTPLVVCDRMVIEFTEVSADSHTSNGAISAVAGGLELIKPEFGSLPLYAAAGLLADRNYIDSHKIEPSDFEYTSNGDKDGRPLSGAFDNNYGPGTPTYWVSEIVTDSFKPILTFDFHRMATVECILNFHAYSTDRNTNTRRFDGFPLELKIYRTMNDDDSYELVNSFEGPTPNDAAWTNTQYAFNAPIRCKKMKIEFINVTADKSFSNGEIRVASNQFIVIGAIDPPPPTPLPTQTPIPTRSPMPNTNLTYINNEFTGVVGVDQIQTNQHNVYQISGCTFKDINISNKDFYIKAENELLFYDNIFENTKNPTTDVAGVFWDNYNGKITISNCKFIKIASRGKDCLVINTNADDEGSQLELIIERSEFIDCGRTGHNYPLCNTVDSQGILKFIECNFTFNRPDFSFQVLEMKNNNAVFEGCRFINCASDAIRIGTQGNNANPIGTFIFRNNYVKSNKGCLILAGKLRSKPTIENNIIESTTLANSYLISITHNQNEIELINNTFSHITSNNGNTNSESGGSGISLKSTNTEYTIKFTLCKFYDNTNNHETTPNSHGGSFQYGLFNEYNANIEFEECEFKNNQVKNGHGGGIAIRTSKSVSIRGCTFDSNTANNEASTSSLLFNNHYDEKGRGYGGALYINPSFHSEDKDYYMISVAIIGCIFKSNKAYQGYAIYIEGEDCDTSFQINNNQFNNNQGINDHINQAGIIATEILNMNKEEIEGLNQFSNSGDAENFIYVYHSGELIPDPTPARTIHPDTVHTYINKNFTGVVGVDQIQTNQHNVRQISGCIFKDINISTRDFYIQAETELLFYDNIFENTENPTTDVAGVFWDNYNGKITISNCKFIKIASRGKDCLVINTNADDEGSQLELVIERSEFIDCGRTGHNYPLCNTVDSQGILKFIECNFTFNRPDFSFQVLEMKNNNAVFEGCRFINCASDAIRIGTQGNNANPIGTFIFRNNYVKSNQGCLILAGKLRSKPTIENNIIESTTLANSYLISITHNQNEIELINNTFSHITSNNGNTNSESGGAGISLQSTNAEYTIKFTLCKFYDITNNHETTPNSHGGSFQYGFTNEFNANIEFKECEFKNNQVKGGHGGSIAIRTSKSVSIRSCIFESNTANNGNDLSGSKGFGGAIYISSAITSDNQENNTQSITIAGCTFISNHAYQGYAIYLQGPQDSATTITINENNKFVTNQETTAHPKEGGIIATEMVALNAEQVEKNNDFTGQTSTTIKHVLQVNSTGNPLLKDIIVIKPSDVPEKRVDRPNKDAETTESAPIIQVKVTDFVDIKHEGDFGGAIYVTNYGLECDKIKFDNCSTDAAGGGIYIKNDKLNLDNNVFLSNLKFNNCKAVYGGAVYVYSESETANVTIKKCEFTNNEASDDETLEMFGGSSIFLSALRGIIIRCKFSNNIGPSVKLYNQVNNEAKNLLSNDHNSILITNCEFNKESIYFIRARKDISYEINDCSFTGKLNKKSRYIDGKTINENGQKLVVKNCKFDVNQFKSNIVKVDNKNVLNDYYNYISIDLNDQHFALDDKKDDEKKNINKLFLAVLFTVGIAMAGLIVIVVIKLINLNHENDDDLQLNLNDPESHN